MQTFLPLPDFQESARALDYRRLGKQRVEAKQILNSLRSPQAGGWRSHPAVKMWEGCERALELYHDVMIMEWVRRGYRNTMVLFKPDGLLELPWWFGRDRLHASHRSNLIRKNPDYYQWFRWAEDSTLEYWWPAPSPDYAKGP